MTARAAAIGFTLVLAAILLQAAPSSQTAAPGEQPEIYEALPRASADGIGKAYMGREIARVMGYQGAAWLERPERERDERPDQVVERLGLEPDDVVADVGAGTGYFTFRLSRAVADGRVYAVDLQPQMLTMLEERRRQLGAENVSLVRSSTTDSNLPAACCDLVLMVDVYHELSQPREMMASIVRALAPGGRVVLVEYRGEDPSVRILPLHKMTEAQARREMAAAGLVWRDTLDFLPTQHVLIFATPD